MRTSVGARSSRIPSACPRIDRFLVVPLVLALLAGCTGIPDPTSAPTTSVAVTATPTPILASGVLRLWMPPVDRLDPIRSTNAGFLALSTLLYDSLFTLDENDEPVPQVSGVYSANRDCTEWTFSILTDQLFSDGSPLVPGDVAASAALWLERGTGASHDALVALSPQFYVNEVSSLVVRLTASEPDLPRLLRFPIIPASYASGKDPDPVVPIPGSGPFRVVSYQAGQGLSLERIQPVEGRIRTISVSEYKTEAEALEAFHSDLLDALPLDETSYRTLRLRKSLKIGRYDGDSLVVPVFGTSNGRRLSDSAHQVEMTRILASLFESDEFLADYGVFPSSRGLSSGQASLVLGRSAGVPSTTPTPTSGQDPTQEPLAWIGTIDVLAVSDTFEAEIGAAIVARLKSLGIPANLRTLPETNCVVAFNNGWYDIGIRSCKMPVVPGAPATDLFSTRTGTPFPDPLIRSRGILLGPRVFGQPVPCTDEIYRGIEDSWVWSGS